MDTMVNEHVYLYKHTYVHRTYILTVVLFVNKSHQVILTKGLYLDQTIRENFVKKMSYAIV